MARRPIKAKKVKKVVRVGKKGIALAETAGALIKDFRPKDPDVLRYGPEPSFADHQPSEDERQMTLVHTYNWYSRFCDHKDAKDFLVQYLEHKKTDKTIIRLVRKAPEKRMVTSAGWAARCSLRGLELTEKQVNYIQEAVDRLVAFANAGIKDDEEAEAEATATPKRKVNVQEIMREKADEAASDIEELFDSFIDGGCTKDFSLDKKVISAFESRNILPQHIPNVIKKWQRLLDEYLEVQAGTCEQLNEGYSNFSKMQIRYTIKLIEDIIGELNGYVAMKQTARKPRAAKVVPVEKTVSRLKYAKAFKDEKLGLDLVGLSPVKLHQATEAWVYDSKRRKLYHFVADEYAKCLTVKGNTVLGFDKKESEMKTLRKPAEQIKEIMGSRPAARKFFKEIKAVGACPTGRFNADMVILKAF